MLADHANSFFFSFSTHCLEEIWCYYTRWPTSFYFKWLRMHSVLASWVSLMMYGFLLLILYNYTRKLGNIPTGITLSRQVRKWITHHFCFPSFYSFILFYLCWLKSLLHSDFLLMLKEDLVWNQGPESFLDWSRLSNWAKARWSNHPNLYSCSWAPPGQ